LGQLLSSVQGVDAAPTPQVEQAARELLVALDGSLAKIRAARLQ
jgi:hypothetical protein